MKIKRLRCFRLGRRLVRLFRRRRRRPTTASYRRLRQDPSSSLPLATKLLRWSRLRLLLCRSPPPPPQPTTPKGHLVVYVGAKEEAEAGHVAKERFVVPVVYFNHPLFAELLREAEEENGFHHSGGITLPCPVSDFERVRTSVAAAAAACGGRAKSRGWL